MISLPRRPFRIFAAALCPAALAACATVESTSVTLDYDPRAHEIGLPVAIEGETYNFLLDTAVDPSGIDDDLAAALGLATLGEEGEIVGVGSENPTAYPSVIERAEIGGRPVGPIEVLVLDIARLEERYGGPLHGVLGYSLLKDHAVQIDYRSGTVTFYDNGVTASEPACATAYRFPLEFLAPDDRLILLPGFSIGGVELPTFIDTGSSNGVRIDVTAPAVEPILEILPEGTEPTAMGARGEARQRNANLAGAVRAGPLAPQNVEVALVEQAPLAVAVGNRFFQALDATLVIDMPAGQVGIHTGCA